MQITVNPTEEKPSTLRALALLFSSIASEAEGAKPAATVVNVHVEQPADPKPAAGAEVPPPPPPPAPVTDAVDTSTTESEDSESSSTASGEGVDSAGLPYDSRIHSSSKNKNADGTWRYLRGGDLALRARVEEELRAKSTPAGSESLTASASDVPPPPPPPPVPAAADAPPPPPPAPAAASDEPAAPDLATVFKRVTALQSAGKLPNELLTVALQSVGLSKMGEFMARKELAPELLMAINALVEE